MITIKQIEIYLKYNGDGDLFNRCSTIVEKSLINYKDWNQINNIIQDIYLVKKGYVSDTFIDKLNNNLVKEYESDVVIDKLMDIALHRDDSKNKF